MAEVIAPVDGPGAGAPSASARGRARPAGYLASLLLILGIIVGAELIARSVMPAVEAGALSMRNVLLLGLGGAALLGLVVVNARWLWATLGNLRFALALITLWGAASVLGTLVVQRFPNQTDVGYARTFTKATGDFLYNMLHFGSGGVIVHPEPDVQRWLDEQYRLFGKDQGEETEKAWYSGEAGRLRAIEIDQFTREHRDLLQGSLEVVSALRLPEAFQISIWFKALLGLLCVALVTVVIQRWRGEWRQVGWAMAHFGMVIFIIGATVRATHKVDGLLPMHVGDTADWYYRNVTRATGPLAVVSEGKQTMKTPLDFEITLHRFKTEYPRQLWVSLDAGSQELQAIHKNYRVDKGWSHPFLDGALEVRVDRVQENVAVHGFHREKADEGPPDPAVQIAWRGADAADEEDAALSSGAGGVSDRDVSYVLDYERAADDAAFAALTGEGLEPGRLGLLSSQHIAVQGTAWPGRAFELPGDVPRSLRVLAIWPDGPPAPGSDGPATSLSGPVAQLELSEGGRRLGDVWVGAEGMDADPGVTRPEELRFQYDRAPVHHRLVDRQGAPLVLATFRDGALVERREVEAGAEFPLGESGDTVRVVAVFDRHSSGWVTGPADTSGMTPEDVYYATLPTALELTLRGAAVAPLAGLLARPSAASLTAFGVSGAEAFERGEGSVTPTADGAGLRVRMVSDDIMLSRFPDEAVAWLSSSIGGQPLSFELNWATNTKGNPLRFTSDVTLSQHGKPLKRGLVEPNRPIYLAGYQFSQTDFNPQDPTYSAFGVVRDPSVRIVYFGMGVVVLGVILLFYVSPILVRRKQARSTP